MNRVSIIGNDMVTISIAPDMVIVYRIDFILRIIACSYTAPTIDIIMAACMDRIFIIAAFDIAVPVPDRYDIVIIAAFDLPIIVTCNRNLIIAGAAMNFIRIGICSERLLDLVNAAVRCGSIIAENQIIRASDCNQIISIVAFDMVMVTINCDFIRITFAIDSIIMAVSIN